MSIPDSLAELAVPIADLVPYGANPRRGDVSKIAESLTVNGQYRPIVVRKGTNEVLAGNHTFQAAASLGWDSIAATWVDCDDEQARRIVLVDNRTNDIAGYDDEVLAGLLDELGVGNLQGTGFSDADLSALLSSITDEPVSLNDPDEAPAIASTPAVSEVGDVWQLGVHRLLVGDSTDGAAVVVMLDGDRPDCVWTDPPYGVSYVGGTGMTIMNDGKAGLPELLLGAFTTLVAVCRPGAPVYVAHADSERMAFEGTMLEAGLIVRQNLVWVKNALVLGHADYQYKHEPILEAEVPDPDHQPILYGFAPGGAGKLGRGGERWHGDNKQTTVLEVPKPPRNPDHPTMKPVELVERLLRNSCPSGGIVLDLFGGSGTTMIAAHRLGLRSRLVELDPKYADVICRRFQEHTGIVPVRVGGESHDFVEVAGGN